MNLPNYILFVLDRLKAHEAYVVGGSVRDHLLKRETNDYDITTSASTKQIMEIFSDHKLILNGLKHGTVRVIVDHQSVEITTYRIDGNYINHRQPTKVTFTTNLYEDLSRRDFTINALCYHPDKGIIDMFDGINDLKHKVIRAIGDPNKRFDEDALRMLRALRFASQLGFTIEADTAKAIHANKILLSYLSKERITHELQTIFTINDPKILLDYTDIFNYLLDTSLSFKKLIPQLAFSQDFLTTLSLLADHDAKILERLSLSKAQQKIIKDNINYQHIDLNDKVTLKKLMRLSIDIPSLASFKACLTLDPQPQASLNTYQKIIAEHEPYLLKHLALNGQDLINVGIEKSQINTCLIYCLDMVITEQCPNTKEALLKLIFPLFH
ncbi:MAG: hypothetical protein MR210_06565 [Erysipelotrichaceae bacterium]|nr:hypothetical protein [Erysipelotrichaceae bacterium]MDY5252528.1 hypothetical protein [Erysipelotrichaceae bacterium]